MPNSLGSQINIFLVGKLLGTLNFNREMKKTWLLFPLSSFTICWLNKAVVLRFDIDSKIVTDYDDS